jgi:hypothetical protein
MYKLQVKTRHGVCHHALPRVLQPMTSHPCHGELRRFHVSCGSGPCLPAKESSDAAMCPTVPDPTSPLRKAPALPRVLQLRTSPPYQGGLRCCHVSRSSGPGLPAEKDSSAATRPATPSGPRAPSEKGVVAGSTKHLRLARTVQQ